MKISYDARFIYLLLLIILAVPSIQPLGLPLTVGPETKKAFDIAESLKPGSMVLMTSTVRGTNAPEMIPLIKVVLTHLFKGQSKIVWITFEAESPSFISTLLKETAEPANKKYGEDYVFLGFIPGTVTAAASFAKDLKSLIKTDYQGTPIEKLPIMDNIRSASDFQLYYPLVTQQLGDIYLSQIGVPYKLRTIVGGQGINIPEMSIYYYGGQAEAMIAGQRGAAEYEKLLGTPGESLMAMDAQSLAHLAILSLIIFGNLAFLLRRRKK